MQGVETAWLMLRFFCHIFAQTDMASMTCGVVVLDSSRGLNLMT